MADKQQKTIRISLRGHSNVTYAGTLVFLQNWTSTDWDNNIGLSNQTSAENEQDTYDQVGASYYVIAVVLVYGMSIVMLIASHIKRRVDKVVEDKQIDRYLQDFQIVKERHARDSYRNLKKTIIKKINWDKNRKPTYHNLQKSIMPLLAIGMPSAETIDISDVDTQSISSSLSNVDLAAAEQYMIAKDRGKVYPGRKHSNALTAAYFAAAKKLSRDQSPHVLAQIYKERKLSRDNVSTGLPSGYMERGGCLDPRSPEYTPRSNSSYADSEILIEEEEPDMLESMQRGERGGVGLDGKRVRFVPPRQFIHSYRSPVGETKVAVTMEDHWPTPSMVKKVKTPVSPKEELQVPGRWYVTQSESKRSRSPSPVSATRLSPGPKSHRSSQSSSPVPGQASPVSPKGSPLLLNSARSTPSITSDGTREELMQITCL